MLDQEAVLDALYNRTRETDMPYMSTIRGSEVSGANPSGADVPKDVCLN